MLLDPTNSATKREDSIEFLCREAPQAVIELEHFGMPFDRNKDGSVYQRPFGGQSKNFGKGDGKESQVGTAQA